MKTTITKVSSKYGAPMGRTGVNHGVNGKVYLRRVPLDSGGYDRGGAYWGIPSNLYEAFTEDGEYIAYFRARSRQEAKAAVLEDWPEATFYR